MALHDTRGKLASRAGLFSLAVAGLLVMYLMTTLNSNYPRIIVLILVLAVMFTVGMLLQLLGCVLFDNWWPMLTGIMYVLVPMPYIFFGSPGEGGYSVYGSTLQSGWVDAGKFLTGFSAVGSIAIPAILAHAQVITTGALLMELAAAVVLGATVVTYDYFNSRDSYSYY